MQNDKFNSLNLSLFGLVAGRAGQAGQVELLLVYGADPGSVDKSGNDAAELAERSGHASLASSTLSLPPTTTGLPTYPITSNKFDFSNNLPGQEEVVRRTEAITRCIQELLISAKDEKFDAFIPCSERIVRAVTDMVALFPGTSHTVPGEADRGGGVGEDVESTPLMPNDSVYDALATLTDAANHFETECRILIMRSQKEPLHQSFVTQQVIQCAFDIAKSTKQLVAQFQ